MTECGCASKKDKSYWHYYHKTPVCDDAREALQAKRRAHYGARRIAQGQPYQPQEQRGWKPGTPIDIPEVDPL